jgi:hypothetical protein
MGRTTGRNVWSALWRCGSGSLKVLTLALILKLLDPASLGGVHGYFLINEVMLNPLDASLGQWVELRNMDNVNAASLDGFYLQAGLDNDPIVTTQEKGFTYNFSSHVVPAGGYLTIGQTSNGGGGSIDVVWPELPSFPANGSANGTSSFYNFLLLYTRKNDGSVDFHDYLYWSITSKYSDARLRFPLQPGASLSRVNLDPGKNVFTDRNYWCVSSSFINDVVGSDKASPGKVNEYICPPVFTAPIFSEIMLNPLNASSGPWFELHNNNGAALSLSGGRYAIAATEFGFDVTVVERLPNVSIPAGGYFTIGKTNLSGHVDFVWDKMPSFPADGSARGNASDSRNQLKVLFRPGSTGPLSSHTSVDWNINSTVPDKRLPFPSQPGASLSRISVAASSFVQDPANWCVSTSLIDGVVGNDKGSPRKSNANACVIATENPTVAPVTKAPSMAPVTKNPTKKPTKAPTKKPNKEPTKKPTKAPTTLPLPKLTGLDLYNAASNKKIVTLTSGLTVPVPSGMSKRPALNVVATFDATATPRVESVVFGWNANSRYSVEAKAAFALCGNDGSDIYSCNSLDCGRTHTVTATPYTRANGQGTAGLSVSVTFTIAGCSP